MPFTVTLAATAGFCMGVRRAVETAVAAGRDAPAPVWTWGELIHNHSVGRRLAEMGVRPSPVARPEDLPPGGTVVIRAHGVAPAVERALAGGGRTVLDATCPLVRKNQKIVEDAAAAGRFVVIAGDAEHAEAVALLARATAGGAVVAGVAEAESAAVPAGALLLAQTTFSRAGFAAIAEVLTGRVPGLSVRNTICAATEARQAEVEKLARACDVVVVVGGAHSANTRRLAEVAAAAGARAILVAGADALRPEDFAAARAVAVSAGASAPEWDIAAVVARLREWGGAEGPAPEASAE